MRHNGRMREQTIILPFPVPLASCFIKSKGGSGIPSARYKEYRAKAAQCFRDQDAWLMDGQVSIAIKLCAPDNRKRDADNLFKCLFDNLSGNVIEDDNCGIVRRASWEWVDDGNPRAEITITQLSP